MWGVNAPHSNDKVIWSGLMNIYEVRQRRDRGASISFPMSYHFGRLWYGEPDAISNAIGYAMHSSRSHDAVIRVYN